MANNAREQILQTGKNILDKNNSLPLVSLVALAPVVPKNTLTTKTHARYKSCFKYINKRK